MNNTYTDVRTERRAGGYTDRKVGTHRKVTDRQTEGWTSGHTDMWVDMWVDTHEKLCG